MHNSHIPKEVSPLAAKNIHDILKFSILHSEERTAIVVFDNLSPLAITLTKAYQVCLPKATFINFYEIPAEEIHYSFNLLVPGDLVVLIQSTSFRLDAFRLRIELFQKSLKVIEHPHLSGMIGLEEQYYINSLAYDPIYYRQTGYALKKLIDNASGGVIESGGERLVFGCRFESAKLNIGDYSEMKNVGGQFPIGEVFTEAQDLEAVNGRVRIYIFGDTAFKVNYCEKPITLVVKKGRVIEAIDSTSEFEKVLENIRADEGEVWVRELGFGLNKAFSPQRIVSDIGTFERVCGIHLSIGAKHGVYKKHHFKRGSTKHHVDVFAVTEKVYLNNRIVFQEGVWCI
ncbi:MAG: hypothetical protein JO131_04675 [Gammaproteobacteria bacterium]|nr:hypothetical protein [Gammaproteobacteria bacterium]